MASVSALGARCMYLSVMVSVLWPTSSNPHASSAQARINAESSRLGPWMR